MKIIRMVLLIALLLPLVACGNRNDAGEPPVTHSSAPAAQEPEVLPDVLTADDMEALNESRRDLINRDTPLGEERDEIWELQNRGN